MGNHSLNLFNLLSGDDDDNDDDDHNDQEEDVQNKDIPNSKKHDKTIFL